MKKVLLLFIVLIVIVAIYNSNDSKNSQSNNISNQQNEVVSYGECDNDIAQKALDSKFQDMITTLLHTLGYNEQININVIINHDSVTTLEKNQNKVLCIASIDIIDSKRNNLPLGLMKYSIATTDNHSSILIAFEEDKIWAIKIAFKLRNWVDYIVHNQ